MRDTPHAETQRTQRRAAEKSAWAFVAVLCLGVSLAGCRRDMQDQPKLKPYGADAQRFPPEGTFPYKKHDTTSPAATPTASPKMDEDSFPFPVTEDVVKRGQERYNVSCSPCHSRVGDGEGLIVKRGFRRPPSLFDDRLMKETVAHFYDVISNGNGAMPSYADQITPQDRYNIIAYIRALQLSQHASIADLTPEQLQKLKEVREK